MSRLRLRASLVLLALALFAAVAWRAESAPPATYSADQVVVLPKDASVIAALNASGYTTLATLDGGYRVLKVRSGLTSDQAVAELVRRGDVISAQVNFIGRTFATVPNDPSFSSQYHLAIMRCTEAWDIAKGATSETIAVVDTGGDSQHADLAARVVFAPGIDVIYDDADPSEGLTGTGHATQVAGAAAAITNNGTDVAGIDWNARVLFIRALGEDGNGAWTTIASGIRKAVDHRASVINLSLGTDTTTTIDVGENALLYAYNANIPVVAAAGNSGASATPVAFPANSWFAMGVGGSNSSDTRYSASSYGAPSALTGVDIVAPGENVVTLSAGATTATSSGTSFAAPLVSGAISILKALRPEYTPANFLALLVATAKDLGPAGYDDGTGWGRLDLNNLLSSSLLATLYPFANDTASVRCDTFLSASPGDVRTATTAAGGRRNRRCLALTGDDVYAGYANAVSRDTGTIEFYFQYSGTQSSETRYIVTQKGAGAAAQGSLELVLLSDSRLQYTLAESGTVASRSRLNPGQWYHVALTYGPRGMILYVNGESEASRNVAGGPPPSDTVYLGTPTSLGGAKSIRGSIDALRFSGTQRVVFPSALEVNVVSLTSTAKDWVNVKWTAVQNETSSAVVSVYADRDSRGYDGTLLASSLSNDGQEAVDLTPLLSFGDTYYIYIVAQDSSFTSEVARAYSDNPFTAYSPLAAILASQRPATENVCVLAPAERWIDLAGLRRLRDLLLDSGAGRLLVRLYYALG